MFKARDSERGTRNLEPGTRNSERLAPEPPLGWSAALFFGGIQEAIFRVYLKGCGHLFVKNITFRSSLRQEGCGRVTGGCQMRMDGDTIVLPITTAGGSNCYTFPVQKRRDLL